MGYRYCPKHGSWLETADYTVDDSGETICPDHGVPVVGFILGPTTADDLRFDYGNYDHIDAMIESARRQNLLS